MFWTFLIFRLPLIPNSPKKQLWIRKLNDISNLGILPAHIFPNFRHIRRYFLLHPCRSSLYQHCLSPNAERCVLHYIDKIIFKNMYSGDIINPEPTSGSGHGVWTLRFVQGGYPEGFEGNPSKTSLVHTVPRLSPLVVLRVYISKICAICATVSYL